DADGDAWNVTGEDISSAIGRSGNVGIGTASPTSKFQINSAATAVPASGLVRLGNADYSNETNNVILSMAPGVMRMDAPGVVGGRFIVGSDGKVGIGTGSPGAKLHVVGNAKITSMSAGTSSDSVVVAGTDGLLKKLPQSSFADGDAWNVDGEDVTSVIGRTGNVGIGTTTPTSKLQINAAATAIPATGLVRLGNADYSSETNNVILSMAPGVMRMDAPGVVGGRFTVNSNGNVGIGTGAPNTRLHVIGNAKITSMTSGSVAADDVVMVGSDGLLKKIDASVLGSDDQNLTHMETQLTGVPGSTEHQIGIEGGNEITFYETDNQNITGSSFNTTTNVLTIGIEDGTSQGINLSHLDNSGTDDQKLTNLSLSAAGVMSFSLEGDGNHTIDLSSLAGLAGGDNLGNHNATTTLNMSTHEIQGAGNHTKINGLEVGLMQTGWFGIAEQSNANSSSYALMQNSLGRTLLNSKGGQDLGFRINSVEKMTLKSDGKVGIGTTTPASKLQINAAANAIPASGLVRLGNADYSNETNNVILSMAPGVMRMDAPGVVGGRFIVNSDGNVGIGTGSPERRFHVKNNLSNWQSRFENGSSNVYLAHGSGYGILVNTGATNTNTNYGLQVRNANRVNFEVKNNGNVLIPVTTAGSSADNVLVVDGAGIVKKVPQSSIGGVGTDDQGVDLFDVSGGNLRISLESNTGVNTIPIASFHDGTGTDDQKIQSFTFNSSNNQLSLEIEGSANQNAVVVDLSPLANSGGSSPIKAYGKVTATGTGQGTSNASVSSIGTGEYQVTFTAAMSSTNYVIQLTQRSGNASGSNGNDAPSITYYDQQANGFKVRITDSDNGVTDGRKVNGEFTFVVIE
ncbi:MAG: hypothetical protein ISP71_06740, partial [Flavobacteriales bacterium]|nr:hypothetical protein [Flavobacteriales bacterium]